MEKSIAMVIAVPFAVLFGIFGMIWETMFVTWMADEMVQRYGWPYLTFIEWFAVNCIVSVLTQTPHHKRKVKPSTIAQGFLTPVVAWAMLKLAMWWFL